MCVCVCSILVKFLFDFPPFFVRVLCKCCKFAEVPCEGVDYIKILMKTFVIIFQVFKIYNLRHFLKEPVSDIWLEVNSSLSVDISSLVFVDFGIGKFGEFLENPQIGQLYC